MIEREYAVRLVEACLAKEWERRPYSADPDSRPVVCDVERHALGWIVSSQAKAYVRTGDRRYLLIGAGPYIVDGEDGGLHALGVVDFVTGAWESAYRVRVRGERMPGPRDELDAELRALIVTYGRISALRRLRRVVRGLGPSAAQRYLTAVQAGEDPQAELRAVVDRALPPEEEEGCFEVVPPTGPRAKGAGVPAEPAALWSPEGADYEPLGVYRELTGRDPAAPGIHDVAGLIPRAFEAEVVGYLRAGAVLAATTTVAYDELSRDRSPIGGLAVRTDGTWFWYSDLAHYVETYHLALDPRFLAHAAKLEWRPPELSADRLRVPEGDLGAGTGTAGAA
ncbi:YrhB domain-containing protein [Embleya scabrispora]|uniref:YrhB domain-containing protein n=1 Tax=Embleya scabrispora TaxID=159449 RepID=UPI00037ABB29|nr:YrhB domain-containing protein [Embleya scabrispora]MYS82709.1 hypothetical protein [Streptomyces sp. SID5474]